MKLERVGLGAALVAVGFAGGYLARGQVERAPQAEVPRAPEPRPAMAERPRSESSWRTEPLSAPPEPRRHSSPSELPDEERAASAPFAARLQFPDGGASPTTFEARLRSALEDCRQGSTSLSTIDCTEYPCIGYLALPSGSSLRSIADCPALASLGSIGVEGMGAIDDAGTTLAAIWVRPEGAVSAEARLRIGERACGLGESYGATCDVCTRCLLGCLQ